MIYIYGNHCKPYNPIQILFIVLRNAYSLHNIPISNMLKVWHTNSNPCPPKSEKIQYICSIWSIYLDVNSNATRLHCSPVPANFSLSSQLPACSVLLLLPLPTLLALSISPQLSLFKRLIFFFSKASRINFPLVIRHENLEGPIHNFTIVCIFTNFIFFKKTTLICCKKRRLIKDKFKSHLPVIFPFCYSLEKTKEDTETLPVVWLKTEGNSTR